MEVLDKEASFVDGCHRYGWVITLIVNLIVLAYLSGVVVSRVDGLSGRIERLERQIDMLEHLTRGGS
jgi:hypothetical protein